MPLEYDLRLLEYMVAIREAGSVSAAARQLRISQPTLSRQLRDLEQRLGVVLFTRSASALVPTPPGEAFCRRATRVLAEADAVLDDVRMADQGLSGRLSIAFVGSAINGSLGIALGRIRGELPHVDLRLVEAFDDAEITAGLLDDNYDVGVHRLSVRDPRLHTRIWTKEPLSLFLATGHPLSTKRPVPANVSVLQDVPLVMWPRETAPRAYDEVMGLCHRAGIVPHVAIEGRSVQTILALVAGGFGAAVMAHSYTVLRRQGISTRPLAGTATTLELVWRATDTNPVLPRLWRVLEVSWADKQDATTSGGEPKLDG